MRGELFQDHFVKWPDDSHAQLPGAHKNKIRIKEGGGGGAVKHDEHGNVTVFCYFWLSRSRKIH